MKNKQLQNYFARLSGLVAGLALAVPATLADPYGPLVRSLQMEADQSLKQLDEEHADDLWARVRSGLTMDDLENPRIAAERRWYVRNPGYLTRVSNRASPYFFHVVDEVERRGLPAELALLPIMESAYDPFAYSHGRAAGMWQIIPGTGRHLGLRQDWWYDGRRDLRDSTDAALNYLTELSKTFDGDWLKALGAYNAGPGRIKRAERKNRKLGKPTDFWSLDLPRETSNYVPRLLALADAVARPAEYGQQLTPIPNTPYFAVAATDGQIDLSQAARLAGLDIETIYRLNPGFNRWASSPDGPHELLLPLEAAPHFNQGLNTLPAEQRLRWVRYDVRSGDTLSGIASRFNTDLGVIREVNKLRGNRIKAGQDLMIPIASAPQETYAYSADQRQANKQASGQGYRKLYRVRSGDSFWSIAREFGVSTRKLAEWNGMAVRDPIHPGQELVLWTSEPTNEVTLRQVAVEIPDRDPVVRKLGYRVRNGDSLAGIADKFNVSVAEILDWNSGLRGKKYIHPGQRLTLYVDITQS